jgi:hypothetical protein
MSKPRPGWTPPNPFPKGTGGNPRGRPKGSHDRTPRNVWELLRSRGDKDPLDVLSQFASSEVADPNLRVQAATALAGYQHGKRPALRFISDITNMPAPRNLEEARGYIARLSHLTAQGKIDVDAALAIRDLLQSYIDAVIGSEVDQRLRVLEEMAREQTRGGFGATVIVRDGLPTMPGLEDVIMPGRAPMIDQKPNNPWGNVPDVGSAVDVAPKRRGRPRKRSEPETGPQTAPAPENRS